VDDGLGDGDVDDGLGDGDSDGDADGLAVSEPLGVGHAPGEVELNGRADGAVDAPVGACTVVAAGVAPVPPDDPLVAGCGHPVVVVAPGEAAVRAPAGPVPAELVPPLGEVPVPTGVPPPSVPDPPVADPPVSTVELTWTMADLNEGTPSAMLAMNATPATTPTGRSQLAPSAPMTSRRNQVPWRGPPVLDWAASVPPAGSGSRRSRGQGRELGHDRKPGRGRCPGHAQWPCQTQ